MLGKMGKISCCDFFGKSFSKVGPVEVALGKVGDAKRRAIERIDIKTRVVLGVIPNIELEGNIGRIARNSNVGGGDAFPTGGVIANAIFSIDMKKRIAARCRGNIVCSGPWDGIVASLVNGGPSSRKRASRYAVEILGENCRRHRSPGRLGKEQKGRALSGVDCQSKLYSCANDKAWLKRDAEGREVGLGGARRNITIRLGSVGNHYSGRGSCKRSGYTRVTGCAHG